MSVCFFFKKKNNSPNKCPKLILPKHTLLQKDDQGTLSQGGKSNVSSKWIQIQLSQAPNSSRRIPKAPPLPTLHCSTSWHKAGLFSGDPVCPFLQIAGSHYPLIHSGNTRKKCRWSTIYPPDFIAGRPSARMPRLSFRCTFYFSPHTASHICHQNIRVFLPWYAIPIYQYQ